MHLLFKTLSRFIIIDKNQLLIAN